MQSLTVVGSASGKTIKVIEVDSSELDKSLLEFLLDHSIPVASSCFGEGACKRCIVNETLLSCQITLKYYFELYPNKPIIITYL